MLVVLVLGIERRTDDLFRRNALDLLRVGANEVLPAAGHDVGPVAVVAQILHYLQHWLVRHLRIKFVEAGMLCRLARFVSNLTISLLQRDGKLPNARL